MSAIFQVALPGGDVRLARGDVDRGPADLLLASVSLDALLGGEDPSPGSALAAALEEQSEGPVPGDATVLAPVQGQEVWASGVTFERSRSARNEEAGPVDIYDRVYDAVRPELFCKATPGRVRGPGATIGIRRDSGWDVPEPELGLVADAAGRLVALTVGNDVSSRSIEGENPLYLPQAKVFTGSCALGPRARAAGRGATTGVAGDRAVDPSGRRRAVRGLGAVLGDAPGPRRPARLALRGARVPRGGGAAHRHPPSCPRRSSRCEPGTWWTSRSRVWGR